MNVIRTTSLSFLLVAGAVAADEKGSALPKYSPFEARGNAAPAAVAANENVEFAGIISEGPRTNYIFHDKTAKKNHWIAVGETKEGISLVSYDPRREQVVVKINGSEKTLALRKARAPMNPSLGVAAVPVGFNTPTPAPTQPVVMPVFTPAPVPTQVVPPQAGTDAANANGMKPQGPATPETQVKQETEARMLVSDLLEIGMAQRKAYEEAQRKAADGNAQPTTNSQLTPTPPPAQPVKE
jgi:hypothetical protein